MTLLVSNFSGNVFGTACKQQNWVQFGNWNLTISLTKTKKMSQPAKYFPVFTFARFLERAAAMAVGVVGGDVEGEEFRALLRRSPDMGFFLEGVEGKRGRLLNPQGQGVKGVIFQKEGRVVFKDDRSFNTTRRLSFEGPQESVSIILEEGGELKPGKVWVGRLCGVSETHAYYDMVCEEKPAEAEIIP